MSSSSEHNSNQFLTVRYITEQKGLTDDQFTPEILRIIKESNRKVVLALTSVKDDIILDGTKFFADAQDTAYLYFDSEYERTILRIPVEAKDTFAKYKESKDLLLRAIRAQPTESKRTTQATASCSYKSGLLKNINGITDDNGNFFSS